MTTKILYTPNEVNDLISKGQVVLFDIRDVDDYQVEHLPGAVNAPDIFYYLSETTPAGLDALHKKFQALFSKAGLSKVTKRQLSMKTVSIPAMAVPVEDIGCSVTLVILIQVF